METVSQDQKRNKNRIIFIDLMRAFAVLMMVQGHTIDTFMTDACRTDDYILFYIWNFMRGLNAPIFMFTSGVVFTYLFKLKQLPFNENPRVKKGIIRFATLMIAAYIMHYPTWNPFDYSHVTNDQLLIFLRVDALHLISLGLLSIIILMYIGEKAKIKDYLVFYSAILFFLIMTPIVSSIKWTDYLPLPLAMFMYSGPDPIITSLFPVFPWLVYVLSGALLGIFLVKKPNIYKKSKFSFSLMGLGATFITISLLSIVIEQALFNGITTFWNNPFLVVLRLGIVLFLYAIVCLLSKKLERIPRIVVLAGQHTLLIYIIHLIILFGSPWTLGLDFLFHHQFHPAIATLLGIAMILLMTLMVYYLDKYKPQINILTQKFSITKKTAK